jgi:hypothetical protein
MIQPGESSRLPQVLVSSAEREQAHALLKEACLDGRLTVDELGQRFDLVERVRTREQLQLVIADLAAIAPPPSPAKSSTMLAIMSAVERGNSRWVVPAKNRVVALMGECKLDLSEATLTSPVTTIEARLVMGALKIRVPEGVTVELEVLTLMGEAKSRVVGPPPKPGAPVVRVTGFALMGTVEVRARR